MTFRLTNAAGAPISDASAQALGSACRVEVGLDTATGCATYNASTDTFQFDGRRPNNASVGNHLIVVDVFAPGGSGLVNQETTMVKLRR